MLGTCYCIPTFSPVTRVMMGKGDAPTFPKETLGSTPQASNDLLTLEHWVLRARWRQAQRRGMDTGIRCLLMCSSLGKITRSLSNERPEP